MDVSIQLANAASVDAQGQVDALGLGWEITGPSPLPGFMVIITIKAPLDRGEEPLNVVLSLVDHQGKTATLGDDPPQPVEVRGTATIPPPSTRPAGLRGGAVLLTQVAPGLSLEPGVYDWVVVVDGETMPNWRRSFYVRAKRDEFPPTLHLVQPDVDGDPPGKPD